MPAGFEVRAVVPEPIATVASAIPSEPGGNVVGRSGPKPDSRIDAMAAIDSRAR